MENYYVYTDHMTVGYDGVPLIENIEIGVRRGEILTLIGPNGSGKSTILKSIIRQLRLLAGTVVLDGQVMAELSERDVSRKLSIVMTERLRPIERQAPAFGACLRTYRRAVAAGDEALASGLIAWM